MISRQQFKRLTLVITVPLLLLGLWLAETETIFPTHYAIHCQELDSHFNCVGVQTKAQEKNRLFRQSGGVFVRHSARLTEGFDHTVSIVELERRQAAVDRNTQNSTTKNLTVHKHAGVDLNEDGPCRLAFLSDNAAWDMRCDGGKDTFFVFDNSATEEKFQNMLEEVRRQEGYLKKSTTKLYAISALSPLLMYFALSLVLLLATRIFRYVAHGNN